MKIYFEKKKNKCELPNFLTVMNIINLCDSITASSKIFSIAAKFYTAYDT